MISPQALAQEFNRQIDRASNSDNTMDQRILALQLASCLYYVMFGVSLRIDNTSGYFNYGLFTLDYRQYNNLEVDNVTGTRYNSPIRRFLSSLFTNKY